MTSFQAVYDGIMSNADLSIRDIRNTYDAKRKFWKNTIADFASQYFYYDTVKIQILRKSYICWKKILRRNAKIQSKH